MRDRKTIDVAVDPPPDILLETDITTDSIDKLPIFAAMRVPEVWLYNLDGFSAQALDHNGYVSIEMSRRIPGLPILEIAHRTEGEARREKSNMLTFRKKWQHWLGANKHLHQA